MSGWIDEWMIGLIDKQTDRQMNIWIDRQMDRWIDAQCMGRWIDIKEHHSLLSVLTLPQ